MIPMSSSFKNSNRLFELDVQLQKYYPPHIQVLARRHWTPVAITREVVEFLVPCNGARILDIGSGVGKFCLAAGCIKPLALFHGVEQRWDLVLQAEAVKIKLQLANVHFMHCNFTQLDFSKYDHFYFYNSFHENLDGADKIDDSIEYSIELYNYYSNYLYKKLEECPGGTRLATFHSLETEIPSSYYLIKTGFDDELKYWIKV